MDWNNASKSAARIPSPWVSFPRFLPRLLQWAVIAFKMQRIWWSTWSSSNTEKAVSNISFSAFEHWFECFSHIEKTKFSNTLWTAQWQISLYKKGRSGTNEDRSAELSWLGQPAQDGPWKVTPFIVRLEFWGSVYVHRSWKNPMRLQRWARDVIYFAHPEKEQESSKFTRSSVRSLAANPYFLVSKPSVILLLWDSILNFLSKSWSYWHRLFWWW